MIDVASAATVVEIPQSTTTSLDALGEWLGIPGASALADTFPPVYHPLANSRRFAILDSQAARLLSHVATTEVSLHDDSRLQFIGSVATDPAERGQGLAGKILAAVIEQATSDGFDAVVLWSDLVDYYRRFGFEPAGEQWRAPIRARSQPLPAGDVVRPASAADLPALLALHERKPLRVRRSLHQLAVLLTARPMSSSVLERDGRVAAYACFDKGADFRNWWHDLGGTDEDVLTLIEAVMHRSRIADATVLIPPYRTELRRALRPGAAEPAALRLALNRRGQQPLFVDGLDSI